MPVANHISNSNKILTAVKKLPYFTFNDLAGLKINKKYLKIYLFRLIKQAKIIKIKKGIYIAKEYIDSIQKGNYFNDYLEFIAGILYPSSYLSLEYILSNFNILTELSWNFTLITKNKTKKIKNEFGIFNYRHLQNDLFCGYEIIKAKNFLIYKATKAKALFDFLYLRKNLLINKRSVRELRLNLESFSAKEIKEFRKYIQKENSTRMKEISQYIFVSEF